MADNKLTREVYKGYADKIVSVLKGEGFYEQFKKRVDNGAASFKLAKKRLIQDISIDWIDTIEEILPNLDTIVRNPRKFIVQEEDIVDVSLARSISTESVKYLAQHTNMISKVDKDGSVTPSKILNITKEESFEIYENRFIYTLLLKLKDFVTMRYDKIKKASATQDVLQLDVESRFNLPSKKVTFRTEYFAQLSFDEVMRLDPDTLTKIERVAKIDRIITDFLSSSFAKSMRNSAPVRPPIMRTNVILKEPNFKKALTLWQFIETYNAMGGFSTSDDVEDYTIESDGVDRLKNMVTLNTMLFESLYDQCESDMNMEDAEFADFLRVGDMDFQKDDINRDEFAQKLDESIENDEEEENIEETKPSESAEEKQKEQKPEEKEGEKEKIVETDKLRELAPKEIDAEFDLEPDADTFDKHLFDVRKVFERADDDEIKQEEIDNVRNAVDRCLAVYRAIRQEELEERARKNTVRRRRESAEKRAAAFEKQLKKEKKEKADKNAVVISGIDPLSHRRAELEKAREEEIEKSKLADTADTNEPAQTEAVENIVPIIDETQEGDINAVENTNIEETEANATQDERESDTKENMSEERGADIGEKASEEREDEVYLEELKSDIKTEEQGTFESASETDGENEVGTDVEEAVGQNDKSHDEQN